MIEVTNEDSNDNSCSSSGQRSTTKVIPLIGAERDANGGDAT